MKIPVTLALLLVISATAISQSISKAIMVDGKKRDYNIYIPKNSNSSKKLPIVFALHGSGGTDEKTEWLYKLDPLADKYSYIVIYPQAIYKNWNIPGISAYGEIDSAANDVHFISSLIDTTAKLYSGDTNRVFVTGLSRGGKFSLYLADKLNSRIKAIAPVCASIPKDMESTYSYTKPMPVLLINGTADPLVNYNGGYGNLNTGRHIGDGFDMLPTEELVKKLEELDKCDTTVTITNISDSVTNDGCTATKYYYKSTSAPVEFIKITGGGHTWPGSYQYFPKFLIGNVCKDFDAGKEIFQFFEAVK